MAMAQCCAVPVVCTARPRARHDVWRAGPSRRSVRVQARKDDEQRNEGSAPYRPPQVLLAADAGLTGSIAVGAAALLGIPLWSLFRWVPDDLAIGFALYAPLLVAEAWLLLPARGVPHGLCLPPPRAGGGAASSSTAAKETALVDLTAAAAAGLWSVDTLRLALALYAPALLDSPAFVLAQRSPFWPAVGVEVARTTAIELLQRGVIATCVARWVGGALYDAGLPDPLQLPLLGGGGTPVTASLAQLGFVAGGVLAGLALLPSALSDMVEAREGASSALLLRTPAGAALLQARQLARQPPRAGAAAASAANRGVGLEGEEPDEVLDPLVLEYRLLRTSAECAASPAPALVAQLALVRGLARLLVFNAAFAATGGNLAACWAPGVLLNTARLAFARWGPAGAAALAAAVAVQAPAAVREKQR